MHPSSKQVAWLNLSVCVGGVGGAQISEFTNPREQTAKVCTRIMNLWVRIQKPRVLCIKSVRTDYEFMGKFINPWA